MVNSSISRIIKVAWCIGSTSDFLSEKVSSTLTATIGVGIFHELSPTVKDVITTIIIWSNTSKEQKCLLKMVVRADDYFLSKGLLI